MKPRGLRDVAPIAAALLFAIVGLVALLYWGPPNADLIRETDDGTEGVPLSPSPEPLDGPAVRIAQRYIDAVRQGDCGEVIGLTWWMQERLARVRSAGESQSQVARVEDELCEDISVRNDEENELTPGGLEDKYVFSPDSIVDVVAVDGGSHELPKPVDQRVWCEVTYPVSSSAPRDLTGKRIRQLRVGLTISTDGYVLKTGVRGNAEIDWNWSGAE